MQRRITTLVLTRHRPDRLAGGAALRNWASFSSYPNEDAAMRIVNDVLPCVRAHGYDARVLLVGREPMVASERRDGAIEITGAVDDVLPYLERPGTA